MTIKGRRFDSLQNALVGVDGIVDVELDEEWLPPHKMAGFTPYDAIVTLEDSDTRWTRNKFEEVLRDGNVRFEKIITLESSTDGTHQAFISLATGSEQGVTSKSD